MEGNTIDMEKFSSFYRDEKVRNYIYKQIEELVPFKILFHESFIMIQLHFPSQSQDYIFQCNEISFLLVLGKGFPVFPPRIHLKTQISQPLFNDCRDLLPDIVGKGQDGWKYTMFLKDIEKKIQLYLKNLKKTEEIGEVVMRGKFHLGYTYPMQILQEFSNKNIYTCFCFQEERIRLNVINLTQTHFLLFETKQQPEFKKQNFKIQSHEEIEDLVLTFYSEICCLTQIKINRANLSQIQLSFSCIKPRNLALTSQKIVKKLKVVNNSDFLIKLIKMAKKFDPTCIKLDICLQSCQNEELQILEDIHNKENNINHHLNKDSISQMNRSYQKGVQYYSLKNLPYFQIFLDKIIRLYQRPDVKVIASSQN